MANSGYIALSRKFFTGEFWNQTRTFSLAEAWIDLVQSARFEANPALKLLPNGKQIIIKRGELHASLRFLSSRWGWSIEKTKRFIDNAIKNNAIKRKPEQGESILILCNYDKYNGSQYADQYNEQNTDPYTAQTPTHTPTRTNNNKEKKENKGKKENNDNPHNPLFENFENFEKSEKTWREDFEIYKEQLRKAFTETVTPEYIAEREEYHPNLDIYKTIEKACVDFWSLKAGWEHKKKSRTKVIDWKATFNNILTLPSNRVYKQWKN
jgi:hypothetical protein